MKGRDRVTQDTEQEPTEPTVADVPEPDQPGPDETEEEEAHEAEQAAQEPTEASGPMGDDPKAVKKLQGQLTGERERHAKRLGDILGDASTDTLPCPLCFHGLMGFVLPGDAETMPEDQKAAALAFLGAEGQAELNEVRGFKMCPTCNGFGELKNPTRVPHYLTRTCHDCQGNGFIAEQQAQSNVTQLTSSTQTWTPPPAGEVGPCPRCGAPNSDGKPHFCNPAAASGV